MTREEIRTAVLAALGRVAPEADLGTLRPDLPMRDQVDIDSMDFLNFLVEIHQILGVDVPEADYREFRTLDACVEYLAKRSPSAPPGAQIEREPQAVTRSPLPQ